MNIPLGTPLAFVQAAEPHPAMMLPFAVILAAIALMPFVNRHWWERNYHVVAVALGSIVVGYYILSLGASARMLHVLHEYVSFIALIGSLFVVAGGIHIGVKGEATPVGNSLFLLVGALLANVIGTTGAYGRAMSSYYNLRAPAEEVMLPARSRSRSASRHCP